LVEKVPRVVPREGPKKKDCHAMKKLEEKTKKNFYLFTFEHFLSVSMRKGVGLVSLHHIFNDHSLKSIIAQTTPAIWLEKGRSIYDCLGTFTLAMVTKPLLKFLVC
jgi:hypothetical protein